MRAESIRVMHPHVQAGEGGSIPTSALQLWVSPVSFPEAQSLNRRWHSRLPEIGDPPSMMNASRCFAAVFEGAAYAAAIWTHPVARLLPQTTWLELRRLAIAPDAPRNTASRFLSVMTRLLRRERPWLVRLISYQDTESHTGAIYRAAGWTPAEQRGRSNTQWNMPGRRRPPSRSAARKVRWELQLGE